MRKKIIAGLDIGNYSTKFLTINAVGKTFEIKNCGLKLISKETSFEEKIMQLKDFLKEMNFFAGPVNVSIAGENVIVRNIVVPKMSKPIFLHSLKFEFNKYIPFALSDSVVDIEIFNHSDNPKLMDVIIVAAKKEFVNERENFISQLGLSVDSICVDSLAIFNAFLWYKDYSPQVDFILLNIGSSLTNVIFVNKGVPVFFRDLKFGGDNFTKLLSERLNISYQEAEMLKCQPSLDFKPVDFIRSILHTLGSEISLCIEYVKKNYNISKFNSIYLSGGSAKLCGLVESLEKVFNLEVKLWNPFEKFSNCENFILLKEKYPDFIVTLGLVLNRLI